jgi:hypothetical protein
MRKKKGKRSSFSFVAEEKGIFSIFRDKICNHAWTNASFHEFLAAQSNEVQNKFLILNTFRKKEN